MLPLALRDWTLHVDGPEGRRNVLDGVALEVPAGRTVALVGESGSGKSTVALGALGLLEEPPFVHAGGEVRLGGHDLLPLAEARRAPLRPGRVAMVFQDPGASFNPTRRVGAQLDEAARLGGARGPYAAERARLLREVGFADPDAVARAYPHALSGGMRQRAAVAMALLGHPALLVADEPTTALDVTVQGQLLALLRAQVRGRGMACLLVTHDLGVVAGLADRVAVLYAGRVVEEADVGPLFAQPRHPYAAALLAAARDLSAPPPVGAPPSPAVLGADGARAPGCDFADRCPRVRARCRTATPSLRLLEVRPTWPVVAAQLAEPSVTDEGRPPETSRSDVLEGASFPLGLEPALRPADEVAAQHVAGGRRVRCFYPLADGENWADLVASSSFAQPASDAWGAWSASNASNASNTSHASNTSNASNASNASNTPNVSNTPEAPDAPAGPSAPATSVQAVNESKPATPTRAEPAESGPRPAPALRLDDVSVRYGPPPPPPWWPWRGRPRPPTVAGVALALFPGEVLALVGESGSGKSTLMRAVLQLLPLAAGEVWLGDQALHALWRRGVLGAPGRPTRALRRLRPRMQAAFQDPRASLDPRQSALAAVEEPLLLHRPELGRVGRRRQALALLAEVGLPAPLAGRRPHALSGGQRQRVALARALAPRPQVLLADEPTSALDVCVKGQVLALLRRLTVERGLATLLVTHDLAAVRAVATRTAVMAGGRVVELAPTAALMGSPRHPYTQTLLAAEPLADPARQPARLDALAAATSAGAAPAHGHGATAPGGADAAQAHPPPLVEVAPGHFVARGPGPAAPQPAEWTSPAP